MLPPRYGKQNHPLDQWAPGQENTTTHAAHVLYCSTSNLTSPETHKISLGNYTGIGVLIRVGGRYQQKYYSLTDKGFRIATIEQRLHGV